MDIEEILNPVVIEITCAIKTMKIEPHSPAFPTTHPNLRYMITPSMVRMDGVNTPPKAPNFFFMFKNEQDTDPVLIQKIFYSITSVCSDSIFV